MSKVPGLQFKNYLDNMIQKINIEIGLKEFKFDLEVHKNDGTNFKKFFNGLRPCVKIVTITRKFGSRI